jgi:hypothetical protein
MKQTRNNERNNIEVARVKANKWHFKKHNKLQQPLAPLFPCDSIVRECRKAIIMQLHLAAKKCVTSEDDQRQIRQQEPWPVINIINPDKSKTHRRAKHRPSCRPTPAANTKSTPAKKNQQNRIPN